MAEEKPVIGRLYQHYKGGIYQVLSVALDCETQAPMVVYRSIDSQIIWVRSLEDFNAILGDDKEGTYYYKFALIDREDIAVKALGGAWDSE